MGRRDMADVQEVDKLTAEVMRFMLFKAHKQPNVPVKREELRHLITDTYRQRNLPATVISNAQVRLHCITLFIGMVFFGVAALCVIVPEVQSTTVE